MPENEDQHAAPTYDYHRKMEFDGAARDAAKVWLQKADEAAIVAWLAPILATRGDDLVTGALSLCTELECAIDDILDPGWEKTCREAADAEEARLDARRRARRAHYDGEQHSVEPSNDERAVKAWLLQADAATLIRLLAPVFAARGDDDAAGWPALHDELADAIEEISPYDG